jgi:hypothetical protein
MKTRRSGSTFLLALLPVWIGVAHAAGQGQTVHEGQYAQSDIIATIAGQNLVAFALRD